MSTASSVPKLGLEKSFIQL